MTPLLVAIVFATAPGLPSTPHPPIADRLLQIARRATPAQAPVSSRLDVQQDAGGKKKKTPPAEAPGWFEWKQRPTFTFGKILTFDIEAKLHGDMQSSYDGAEVTAGLDTYRIRRTRLGVQGQFLGHTEFEVEREWTTATLTPDQLLLGLNQKSPWKDVYVDVDYISKQAQIRAGKFKIPFGLDELTSVTHNDFVNRSLGADYLAPARDIGLMAHGRFFDRRVNYWAGVFQHDGENARAKTIQGADGTVAGRVTAVPVRRAKGTHFGTLEIGAAMTLSDLSNDASRPNGLRGRTVVTQDDFFSPVYVEGRRQRWETDLDWMIGPASLRAEYTHVTDDRLGQGLAGEDLPDARYQSWYVGGTYLLTGEKKVRPVKPRAEFLRGGAGAFELAARYERIWDDSVSDTGTPLRNPRATTIFPNRDSAVTIGVNWILNRWLTLQINGIREQISDPGRSPVPEGAAFWSRAAQIQFTL